MQKILAVADTIDNAYKKVFYIEVYDNIWGLAVEFASRPSSELGFKIGPQRAFTWFGFFSRNTED